MPKKAEIPRKQWEVTFVRCDLDKATKDKAKSWDVKFEQTIDGLERLILDGYKVSMSHDKYNDCVGVFATMPDQSHQNHGMCLTARGPGMLPALKMLIYKHFHILDAVWDTEVNQENQRDQWG